MIYSLSELMYHVHDIDSSDSAPTAECPPFLELRELALSPQPPTRGTHIATCAWCQRVAAANWSARCPSPAQLAAHAAGGSLLGRAMEAHIAANDCGACRQLLARFRRQQFLEGARGWISAFASSAGAFVHLPEAPLVAAAAAPPLEPWRLDEAFPRLGVRLSLQEDEGELWATLDSPKDDFAGARFRVELIGEDDARTAELILSPAPGGCQARYRFGTVAELGRNVGYSLSILVCAVQEKVD